MGPTGSAADYLRKFLLPKNYVEVWWNRDAHQGLGAPRRCARGVSGRRGDVLRVVEPETQGVADGERLCCVFTGSADKAIKAWRRCPHPGHRGISRWSAPWRAVGQR
ncbi:hypothetical protein PR202_ga17601 [Eleusine coracana subsp. coracana]|uniref:Uncharacterized protein n=1 Tax=Eleusine coracana subsp. coracana TaxID=191504 RepID=A0AAV5CQK2_ELECO|nr:hypothetical protein PR202_ga17354 [Eleusine coracana subsp. coracana]GJN00419.1 hypothetical protein PR202_ga17601 [Eleusine coracana subsp. coracana]